MNTLMALLMILWFGVDPARPKASADSDSMSPKIGFVDWSRLLNEYQKNQDQRTRLQGQRDEVKRLASAKGSLVKRLTAEVQLLKKNTEYYFSKRQELMDAASSLRLFSERTQAEFVQHESGINADIYRDIQSAIRRFALQHGYVGIFRLEQDPTRIEDPEIQAYKMNTMLLFYAAPDADVTAQVLEVLNREYGRTATARSAPVAVPPSARSVSAPREGESPREQPARPGNDAPDGEEPQSAAPSTDDMGALMKQLLVENRILNERIASLEAALQSTVGALVAKVNEIDHRADELAAGYVASRTSQVAGSVQGRMLWNGEGLVDCSVKLVHAPMGNTLDALARLFDVGIKPENRRTEFVGMTDERGVFTFEGIPIGPYKVHWRSRNAQTWVRRLRKRPDVVVEAGTLVYCSDVEANIRALN